MLSGELGDLETEPVNSSGSANIYKTTYKECEVTVRVSKAHSKEPLEAVHKVRILRCTCILCFLTGLPSGWSRR